MEPRFYEKRKFMFEADEWMGYSFHEAFMRNHLITETLHQIPRDMLLMFSKPYDTILNDMENMSASRADVTEFIINCLNKKYNVVWGKDKIFNLFSEYSREMADLYYKFPFILHTAFGENVGSRYQPQDRKIIISILPEFKFYATAYLSVLEDGGTHKDVIKATAQGITNSKTPPNKIVRNVATIVKPQNIQMTFAHELSHWMNDVKHNFNLKNVIASKGRKNELLKKQGNHPTSISVINAMSKEEIDAQVHAISELRNNYSKIEWDKLSFIDLTFLYPVLWNIISINMRHEGLKYDKLEPYLRDIFLRIHRGHLLGAKMDYSQVFKEPEWYN